MFYIYKIDHLGEYKKIWKLVPEVPAYETAEQANRYINAAANHNDKLVDCYRVIYFSEPKDVPNYAFSIYYSEAEKAQIRKKYFCR